MFCMHELQEVEVDLIITDYWMPGMTGYDLLRKVKECRSLKDIPVVIMSSENEASRINMCLEEGAQEFLVKPVRQSDVNNLIKPHLFMKTNNNNNNVVSPPLYCSDIDDNQTGTPATETVISPGDSTAMLYDTAAVLPAGKPTNDS